VTSAAENQLENASDSCELWSKWFAWLVAVSIVAEFIIAAAEAPYGLFLKLSATTDAGVAIGIVGEVMLGMRNNRIQTELRKRSNDRLSQVEFENAFLQESAALATERAAKLEREAADARERTAKIEQLTAWRHISPEQKSMAAGLLKRCDAVFRLFVEYQNGDPEAFMYAGELAGIFTASELTQTIAHDQNLWLHGGLFGASISVSPEINVAAVLDALGAAAIPLTATPWPTLKMWPISQNEPRPNVFIAVYPKPPSEFLTAARVATGNKA
jgi:hypothetical protein